MEGELEGMGKGYREISGLDGGGDGRWETWLFNRKDSQSDMAKRRLV